MRRRNFYKVIFEPQKEGGYTVYVPVLPGCVSEGETYDKAFENIKQAIKLYLETLKDRGKKIPRDTNHIVELECSV